jgi:hypothetical protein
VKSGACFKFHLPLVGDMEIMSSRSDLGDTYQQYFVCDKKITPSEVNDRFILKADIVNKSCSETPNDMNMKMIVGDAGHEGK